jgi:NTE family protein
MKIGLVLSGGGARGFAHIGVLKILKQNNIPIDVIAGCSSGALIGACYASDQNPERIEKLAEKIKSIRDIMDLSFSRTGFITGKKISGYIEEYLNTESIAKKAELSKNIISDAQKDAQNNIRLHIKEYFEDLKNNKQKTSKKKEYLYEDMKIPLFINATDINSGKEVIFSTGPLLPGILASISIPGVFSAKSTGNQLCVDGGVINPLPINIISSKADYIIIVDVSVARKKITEKSSISEVFAQSLNLMQGKIVEEEIKKLRLPHIIIKPAIDDISMFDFDKLSQAIREGENAAKTSIENILRDINISKKKI